MIDLKSSAQVGNPKSENGSRKLSSKQSGRAHEQDYSGVCLEHTDTRFAPVVLGKCSQHDGVSDQQSTLSASELWDTRGDMDRQRGKPVHLVVSLMSILSCHRSKLDPKSRRCIFIGYKTGEYETINSGIPKTARS